jgi:TRAP-type C4-dicarboxylate transport system permease small subunit
MNVSDRGSLERLSLADWLLVGLFCLILAIILLAVFFRYVVNHSLFWSDEVVRYLFVWFTLLGASLVLRDRRHIRVEYFVEHLPARVRRVVEALGLLLILAFHVFLVVGGFLWVYQTSGARTPALGLPLNWVFYAALPSTAAVSGCFAVRRFLAGHYAELDAGE